ncbi:STAS/SEC14 domain-containing protein [Echinicola sp. CAU 1574]|uniref:STAS/SEC14 domain-containing protein n=2 Tax=Echinicola arenosa TaxID=2774144 RepID=A0ABR9AJF8_9BACT|nr:STAS/SEC14 domain-containing protein [Echinicola arenosa]
MIEQLETYPKNVLSLALIDNFSTEDEKLFEKLMEDKLAQGYEQVNVLIKLDELKVSNISVKAFFEDVIYLLRKYKRLGNLAVVAHSKVVKALVPIDNLFFERSSLNREERYFDVSQMAQALKFVGV